VPLTPPFGFAQKEKEREQARLPDLELATVENKSQGQEGGLAPALFVLTGGTSQEVSYPFLSVQA
jgi:hypothetical protein